MTSKKDELNKIFDSDNYNIFISKQLSEYNIIIESKVPNTNLCGNLTYNDTEKYIKVNMIAKCSLSGTLFLEKLDELAKLWKLNYISLEDKSNLIFSCNMKKIKINLALLNILSIGQSWYNSKGYISSHFLNEQTQNLQIINKNMNDLLASIRYPNNEYVLPNETVSEFFIRIKTKKDLLTEQNCTFILWLYGLFNKIKEKNIIMYNVNLKKYFYPENFGGMKKIKAQKQKTNKTKKQKTKNKKTKTTGKRRH